MLNNKKIYIALGWTLIVTLLSLATLGSLGESVPVPYKDKIVHFLFYFVFVLLWYFATKTSLIKLFFIAVAYGVLMEILQSFTKTRSADYTDAIANTLGALSAVLYIKNKKS